MSDQIAQKSRLKTMGGDKMGGVIGPAELKRIEEKKKKDKK